MPRRVSRRRFLRRAGTGAAGVVILGGGLSARSFAANNSVGVGLVGVSGRGAWFMSLLGRKGYGMRPAALCDVNSKRAAEAFAAFPDVPKFADFRTMLDKQGKDIDGVIAATPEFSRAIILAAAIKAGKAVLGEKPLTRTPHEARVLRELARKHKAVTQMGNQGSSRTTFQQAKALVHAGLLGDLKEVHVWSGGSEPRSDAPRKVGRDRTPPTGSQPVPGGLHWDLWLAGAARRDYHVEWYQWKRWRDFFTSSLGWAGPHSAALGFMSAKIHELWDAVDLPKDKRTIRVTPKVPGVYKVGLPQWEIIRYDVPARGRMAPLTFTWHKGAMHFIEKALGGYPEWRDKKPRPWWTHGGSAFVGTKGKLDATHYGDHWNVYPAELAKADALKGIRGEGHEQQWIKAIRGQSKTVSNFDVSGPLTELLMLGNVATLVGEPLTYDPVTGTVLDHPAAQAALHTPYRKGWSL